MKLRFFGCLGALLLLSNSLRAEVSEVRIAQLYGLGYLPLTVMEERQLLEKHAKAAGLENVKVSWVRFSGSNVANDAMLSGNLHFASGGVPGFTTLWAKTKGKLDAKAVGAMNAMPLYLNTRNPNVMTVKGFTAKDKIAVPAVKVSAQSIILQMAAEQAFGQGHHYQLDPLTVTMSHPDGMVALMSGGSEVDSHFASPPYQYQELEKPGVHTVLNSYDVMGGPATFSLVWSTNQFRQENPKVYDAFVKAFEEAIAAVNKDKRAAAETYLKVSGEKGTVESILRILNDPNIEYSTTPRNMLKQVDFLYRIGSIKVKPESWKEMFFPNVHKLPGS
jgi:NitT/TauT family transport system substrate-binding protein